MLIVALFCIWSVSIKWMAALSLTCWLSGSWECGAGNYAVLHWDVVVVCEWTSLVMSWYALQWLWGRVVSHEVPLMMKCLHHHRNTVRHLVIACHCTSALTPQYNCLHATLCSWVEFIRLIDARFIYVLCVFFVCTQIFHVFVFFCSNDFSVIWWYIFQMLPNMFLLLTLCMHSLLWFCNFLFMELKSNVFSS